nr:nickel pincer cofactor biosynthesis protein LarB [uncultured Holophaga sp.]
MDEQRLRQLLQGVREGRIPEDEAMESLRELPFADMGYAKLDLHRGLRRGQGEVIFCQGKTPEQTRGIFQRMLGHLDNVLGTRASRETFEAVAEVAPDATWHPEARIVQVRRQPLEPASGFIAVVTAGTSDIPVAEEAALTAEFLGNRVERLFDVGVAGVHRLLAHRDRLEQAAVVIAVAGMEGALPSVVAGLVPCPVVAVPTSIGYGASFGGVAALLAMLNSCASGVGVVNIDNGYGAAALASLINRRSA